MTRKVSLYLREILQSMQEAQEFTKGMTYEFGVDLGIVWLSVKERIPAVQPRLQAILEEVEKTET